MGAGGLGLIVFIVLGLANDILFVTLFVCIGDKLLPPGLMEVGALGFIFFIIAGLANDIPFVKLLVCIGDK